MTRLNPDYNWSMFSHRHDMAKVNGERKVGRDKKRKVDGRRERVAERVAGRVAERVAERVTVH